MIFEITISDFNRKLFDWFMTEIGRILVGDISLKTFNKKFRDDLGINFLTEYYGFLNTPCYRFRVVDEKKFMLTKIKYGI